MICTSLSLQGPALLDCKRRFERLKIQTHFYPRVLSPPSSTSEHKQKSRRIERVFEFPNAFANWSFCCGCRLQWLHTQLAANESCWWAYSEFLSNVCCGTMLGKFMRMSVAKRALSYLPRTIQAAFLSGSNKIHKMKLSLNRCLYRLDSTPTRYFSLKCLESQNYACCDPMTEWVYDGVWFD